MTPQQPTSLDHESIPGCMSPPQPPQRARSVVVWVAIVWVGLFYAGLLAIFVHMSFVTIDSWASQETPWTKFILEHASAVFGIPLSCAAALFAVLFLESHHGHMEIKALGIEFKGAAAPIVMWIFCFLSLVVSVKLLW